MSLIVANSCIFNWNDPSPTKHMPKSDLPAITAPIIEGRSYPIVP